VQPYATTFVQYGSWRHEPSYGYVWYPRVHAGWRPYYHGRWSHYRPWGWTWIGSDPWAWPTHHYGRWGFSAGVWFWIPGTVWGPAWVSWAYAPGYVSWCPLGWNNRPVFHFNTRYYHGGRYYDPWRAWTVVPHRRFGTGYVNAHVVNGTHIDARTRGAFVARTAGPNVQGYAVPRSATPIRVAGGRLPGGVSGTPAYSTTSPGRSAPNASTTLRGRRSTGEPLSGSGLPAPAREPRSSSTLRTAPSTAGQPARSRVPSAVSGETGTAARRAEPRSGVPVSPSRTYEPSRRTAPSAPSGETGAARRAEPRSGAPASPSPTYDSPSRRPAPQYRATPSAPAGSQSERAPSNPSERYRAVPRTGDRYSQAPPSAPSVQPDYGRRAPDYGRREPPGTSGYGVPRAVPRSGPESDGGPRTYRPSPGASERRAPSARPSGPPASAAPSRPSGSPPSAAPPSNRGGSGGESRPRGGQPSRGTARSRG
jgi:hypothetical protein